MLPQNATEKAVLWESSDGSVATVSQDGAVRAVGRGVAFIIVTTEDGGRTARCQVNVVEQGSGFTVTFDGNGGTPDVGSLGTDSDGHLTYIPGAVRDSYTFLGWYTARQEGAPVDIGYTFNKDTVVYAQWNSIPVERIVLDPTQMTLLGGR